MKLEKHNHMILFKDLQINQMKNTIVKKKNIDLPIRF